MSPHKQPRSEATAGTRAYHIACVGCALDAKRCVDVQAGTCYACYTEGVMMPELIGGKH